MRRTKQGHAALKIAKLQKRRSERPPALTVIEGETAPDERNANVQQSERVRDISEDDPW